MTKPRLPKGYAQMVAEKAMELANLALAGIVFVQLAPGQPFGGRATFLGVLAFIVLHIVAYYTMKEGGDA